jgi:hypothetical protein
MPSPEIQPDETGSKPVASDETPKTHRSAFARLTRELSDEDLDSPGARKLLLDRLAEAQDEIAILRSFRERFHEADKYNGMLQEKLKANTAAEVISVGALTIGAAIAGLTPTLWKYQPDGWLCLGLGVALIVIGVVAKVILLFRTKAAGKHEA